MKLGSIEDIVARLTLWNRRAPKGLARVEFDSEFARKRVINGLRLALAEAGIPFHEIDLPVHKPAPQVVRELVDQLNTLVPGVVSITGFATVFPDETSLEDSLRIFNFNREELARPALRQIWWMPTHFAEKFIRAVPDLNSWFMIRLRLTEVVPPPSEVQPLLAQPDRVFANIEDARKRAAELVARFERALAAGVPAKELRHDLAIPAVSALLEGGAEKEARELALTLAQKIAQSDMLPLPEAPRTDFFISYASADGKWAEWIAYQLEEEGYSAVLQAWDFQPGANFVLKMQEAAVSCRHTIAVLSHHYQSSKFAAAEWAAAFAIDPTGEKRTLIPVRVASCEPQGLLGPIVYIDLVGLDEAAARDNLLSRIRNIRAKPQEAPEYPGIHIPAKLPPTERPEFPGTLPPLWSIPYPRNPFFTGREKVLEQLHEAFSSGEATAPTHLQVISGLGGVGKTQTVVEYAYQHRDEYKAAFLASAATELALVASYIEIANLLELPEKDAQNQDETVRAVKNWLEKNPGWLLIFDNADNPGSIKPFLPDDPKSHVLVTSRAQVFDTLGVTKTIELTEMPPEEAVQFLYKRTGRDDREPAEKAAAEQIANELGGLPLALEQAGAYITRMQCRFQDYLVSYRKRGLELLEKAKTVTGEYPKSVATTWSLNFEQVEQISQASADLLRFSAFLDPDKIPLELVTLGAVELGPALSAVLANVNADPLVLDEVLEPLTQYSLIRRDLEVQTYDIHCLVQAVLKNSMDEPTQRLWGERAVRAVNRAFPDIEVSAWPLCERLLPHAQASAALVDQWRVEDEEAARLLNQAGYYLCERARYAQAEPLYQRALAIQEKVLGSEHPDVALILNNLATLYDSQGQYAQAESLLRQALAIREKVLGSEHPDVAQSLNNLAMLYTRQGQYAQAEPLLRQALAIWKKVLGPEHPAVATSLNNLASLYTRQRQYAQAAPLLQRALAIQEKVLGPEHPTVAASLNNLAGLCTRQGQYVQAEPLYQRALAIQETVLGPEHPAVATSLNNLATLYNHQGQYVQAEPLYQRVLAIQETVLGPEHPAVATSLNNLATLYNRQGQYAQAEPLYQRALAIREKVLGPEHPDVATVLKNYAFLLRQTKREAEAEKMEARAKAIRTQHAHDNPTN
ncbi:MAG TPA: FxSxx-COOH system tetratricopeptide repeat protein [Candidatus Binatia bacterium]|nr:FxSxx-COOH system tetratricopeptide repeat protein [Candidatus Binatia bacterium]